VKLLFSGHQLFDFAKFEKAIAKKKYIFISAIIFREYRQGGRYERQQNNIIGIA